MVIRLFGFMEVCGAIGIFQKPYKFNTYTLKSCTFSDVNNLLPLSVA